MDSLSKDATKMNLTISTKTQSKEEKLYKISYYSREIAFGVFHALLMFTLPLINFMTAKTKESL